MASILAARFHGARPCAAACHSILDLGHRNCNAFELASGTHAPAVTLLVEPRRYPFTDFVKMGVPTLILTWLATLLLAPLLFPYGL